MALLPYTRFDPTTMHPPPTQPMTVGGRAGQAAASGAEEEEDDYDPLDDAEDLAVEKTRWSGQAGLDVAQEGSNSWGDIASRPLLAFGDVGFLLAFATIGRSVHSGGFSFDLQALVTAAPFVGAWFLVAPLLGAYTPEATRSTVRSPCGLDSRLSVLSGEWRLNHGMTYIHRINFWFSAGRRVGLPGQGLGRGGPAGARGPGHHQGPSLFVNMYKARPIMVINASPSPPPPSHQPTQGEVPPTPFIAVSMVMTLLFLGAWRSLFVALTGSEVEVKGTQGKKSGVMDIFRMVTTLINRW